jgi:hypothetical protein
MMKLIETEHVQHVWAVAEFSYGIGADIGVKAHLDPTNYPHDSVSVSWPTLREQGRCRVRGRRDTPLSCCRI